MDLMLSFAENCKEAGAGYVMFALGQNDGYYCSPNHAFDSIVGIAPGDLCSKRDLPADLFNALDKRGIRMMFIFREILRSGMSW